MMEVFPMTLKGSELDHHLEMVNRIKKELNCFASIMSNSGWKVRKGMAMGCFIEPMWLEFSEEGRYYNEWNRYIYFNFSTYLYVIGNNKYPEPPVRRNCIEDVIQYIENDFC